VFSLLDTVGCDPRSYLLVYQPHSSRAAWWTRSLDPRFAHVEVWRRLDEGIYLTLQPFHDYLVTDLVEGEPNGVVQRVVARRPQGLPMFPIGVKTCVSVAKAMLGIRAAWVLTPYQLHKYVAAHGGVV
jgi:hypothetical protein